MFSENPIKRRHSRRIMVGRVAVGGDAPVSVQSMTNTETTDVAATVAQIQALENAGADIVRVSIPTLDAAEAFGRIVRGKQKPVWGVGDAIQNMKIIDAFFRSEKSGRWEKP